jgi:hypothetical protein
MNLVAIVVLAGMYAMLLAGLRWFRDWRKRPKVTEEPPLEWFLSAPQIERYPAPPRPPVERALDAALVILTCAVVVLGIAALVLFLVQHPHRQPRYIPLDPPAQQFHHERR